MSVDTRLREAFRGETWDVETRAALHLVHERAHRARVWKTAALAGVVAVIGAVGAAAGHGRDQGMHEPVGPVPSGATSSPLPGHPTGPSAIDGTWEVGQVMGRQIRGILRQAGQGKWYGTVISDFPQTPLRYRMTIRNGRIDMVLTGADGERVPVDQEYVSLSGHQAELEPLGGIGVNRYRWALAGDRLRLTFVSTSEGQEDVTPNGALQRALYTVADWTRASATR